MKTLKLTSAWILIICSIIAVSSVPSDHASSHHAVQHGANTPQKTRPDTLVPVGVQLPEHVLSTQDVSCISADDNIFQIMHEAQKTCNGTDMRCTFYHFVNHGYQNIGSLDVNKELFDELLMKFDNWLLTAESIHKDHVHGKTNEYNPTNMTKIHENDKYNYESKVENPTDNIELDSVHTNQGTLDDNFNESNDDRIHDYHIKNPDEIHHRNHHHKWKNGKYNKEHRYFEVFLPKDRETGKPRTIYVEVDQDKNEFVLLDEDIDKKLNGIKPVKIELDELSGIADTAFDKLVKSSNHKKHIHNINSNDNRVMVIDLNTNAAIDKSELLLDISNDESSKNIVNSTVCDPHICNIDTNQQLTLNNGNGNDNNILNIMKNPIISNKYINQDQFQVESQINNTTEDNIINDHYEILQNINETDILQSGFFETESLNTVEFDHNNITHLDVDADYIELNSSQEFLKIPCENEYNNCTEHYDFSADNDIPTYDGNDFIQLEENNDTSNDNDFDDTQEFLYPKTIDLNEPVLQDAEFVQETKLKPKLTSSLTDRNSDYASSWLHLLPSENQKTQTDLHDRSSMPKIPIKSFSTIPILGKDLVEVVEKDSHLQSSFPVYATTGLSESDSHNHILNSDLHPAVSPRDYILPLPSNEFSCKPKFISPHLSMSTTDPNLFQILPSHNIDVQEPYLGTAPLQLEANIPLSTKKNMLPSTFASPKSLGDFDKIITTDQFNESPLSVIPYSLPYTPSHFLSIKDNLGLDKYSHMDNNIKDTIIPCSCSNRNRYPCNTIPCSSNLHLKPPQLIPAYFEPPPHVTPLQSTSKTPTLDSLPISLEQSNLCFNADYPREIKPIPFLPLAPDTPLNPPWLRPGSFANTYPDLWNNIPCQTVPSLPYTILPVQNIWNYSPILSDYLTPNIGQQKNQILKPLPTKEVSKPVFQQPYATKNILQMTPSSNTLYSPIYPRPIQIDSNPSLNLERDLQTLSCKYGIPLTKIFDALDAEISSTDNQINWSPIEPPHSKFVHDSSLKGKSAFSATNADVHNKNRSGNKDLVESDLTNLTPLDSTLIGPHLEIDDALLQGLNNYQTYTVASEITGPQRNQHLQFNKNPDNEYQESSLIGSQLPSLATSNIQLSDEDRIGNKKLHLETDSYNLVALDSSLIGPHLKVLSPSLALDSNIYKNDILTSYTEVPVTSSLPIKTKINQSHLTSSSLDNFGLHLKTLSPAKPLFSDGIQITNEILPLESDITELTSLDSLHVDLVNDLKQSEILQHEKTVATVNSTILYKPVETESNFIEEELLPKSDSSKLIPLDSSLIEPYLQTGNLPIITNTSVDKSESFKTHKSIENTDINSDEMESIILPSSMLTTLLNKAVKTGSNVASNFHNTKVNKEPNNLLLETNLELPITQSSSTTSSLKKKGFKTIEPRLEIADSTILGDKSESPGVTLEINSKTQLDSSLIGPSLLQESDFREMSPILETVDHLETYEEVQTSNLIKKPLNISAATDSKIQYDSSLTGPNILQQMKSPDTSTAVDSVIKLDDSFLISDLQERIESSAMSSLTEASSMKGTLKPEKTNMYHAFDSNNVLDTSLIGPHLLNAPFSNDEIKMIHEQLQQKSELTDLKPLDSSLIGSHLHFESQLNESELSRYQNPETGFVKGGPPLKPTNVPSELQELLSKFTNAVTKSQLSSSKMKPCDKLLSSLVNMAADNNYIELPCEELHSLQNELASEFYPIPIIPEQGLPPVQYSTKGQPCYNANYYPIPVTYLEHAHAKGVPQLPSTPMIDYNWFGQPLNIQKAHQALPVTFNPNALPPFTLEDSNRLLDLVSHTKHNPQSLNYDMYKPEAYASSQLPLLPKKSFTVLPSNLESTVYNPEYNPIVVDDIMSLIDANTHQLLKDMSILPSTTSTIPTFRGEIVPPLLNTIPITNTDVIKHRPCNSHYSRIPLGTQFSEVIGPPPELISLPTEFPNAPIESQWYKIPNKPQFIESIGNPTQDRKYLQQLLSRPYLDSPIILPSSALDTMLQMPTAPNKLNSINFSPIQTPLANAITSSILPSYAKPLSVSYAKPISTPGTNSLLNLPLPVTPVPSTPSFNPYTTSPIMPVFSSPLTPINTEPSDYQYLQTAAYNKPISSAVPYKPSHSYSSPCLSVHPSLVPFDASPCLQAFQSKITPAIKSPNSLEYIKPMSASYFSPAPTFLTKSELPAYTALLTPISPSPVEPTQNVSPVTPSYSYLPSPASTNTLKLPPSNLSPAYITPISSVFSNPPSNLICLPLDPKSTQNPQIIKQKLQLIKPMNTMPISFENNPFSNVYQMLPISRNTPMSSYSTQVPKSLPYFSLQIKPNVPCGETIQSNIQTSLLTHEVPTYDVKEENIGTHSMDKDNYYHEPNLKYSLEPVSYTLAPEYMAQTFADEDFVSQADLIPVDPIINVATESSTKTNVYHKPLLTHYTPLYKKPRIPKQNLPLPPLTELIQPNIFDNVIPIPSLKPYQASLPTSIQSGQFLKTPTPATSAPNLSIFSSPYTSVIPCKILSINQEPLLPLPNYSESTQNMPSPIVSFKPVPPINLPKLQTPISSDILDNYIQLPTHYESISKTFTSQRPVVESSSMPSYNKYSSPIISHFLPTEEPSPSQNVSPLSLPKNEKWLRPFLTPQYKSSVLPAPTKSQDGIVLSEAPIHYHTYNPPVALPSSVKNIFDPSITSSYTVLPFSNSIIEPLSAGHKPQWSSFSPQYTLPASLSSPIPVSSSTVTFPTVLPVTAPQSAKQALTNHIIPSSLFFMSSNLPVPSNKLASHYDIPGYRLPSPTFTYPIETVPNETPSRLMEKTVLPQNILMPDRQFSSGQFKVPLPSPPYLTQPLELTDYYPAQPSPYIQYTTKTQPKLLPVSGYTSLPLHTTTNRLIYEPSKPQYSLPIVPVYDTSNQPQSAKNPFLNPNFKPILEVPPYPVPNNVISSPKITPFDSVLVSNLQPPDISQESLNSYSSPLPPSVPLYYSTLPKLLAQKSRQYQPQEIPNYSEYVSQLPIESVSEIIPSTSPLLKSSLLKPLLTTSQNNISLFPMLLSRLDPAFPDRSTSEQEYFSSFTPLTPEVPKTVEPINLLPTTSSSLLKSRLNIYYQTPVSTENMPLFSNYDIVESSANPPMKTNIVNTAKPVEVTAISASETSPLSQFSLDSETFDEIKPFEHMKETILATDRVSSLPTYLSQQKKFHPAMSLYNTLALSKYKISKPKPPLLEIPEEVELIDTTDFIPTPQIKSEPLVVDYTPTDRQAPIFKNIPSVEPDISQLSPYTTLSNTDVPPSKSKLTKLQTSHYSNQLLQNSPVYISPQEYKDLIQGSSISKGSSTSSTNFLTSTNTEPQLTISPMTVESRPAPLYTSPISFKPEDWLQSPILAKFLPPQEIPVEVAPEKQNIQSFLNKYKLYNKISPVGINNHPYELISEMPLKLDPVKAIPLRKSGPNTEYDVIELNNFNEYDSELLPYELETKNIELRDNKPNVIDTKSYAEILPEVIEGVSVPTYDDMAHRPQRLSKLDHFYANNHIGKSPQVFTVPAYKTLPVGIPIEVRRLHQVSPDILNNFTYIPTDFENPKIESSSLKPSEFQPDIAYLPENVPIMNSYPINYIYPRLKPNSQRKFPTNVIEITNISEMPYQPASNTRKDNTEDIKYSGYKTYQIPLLKTPKLTQSLGTPLQEYDPIPVPYTTPVHSNPSHFYSPVEMSEFNPQYLTPVEMKTPLRNKLDLETIQEFPELEEYGPLIAQYQKPIDVKTPIQTKLERIEESLEFDEYNPIEDLPLRADSEKEDNELKSSLLNYINKREDVKNNLYNSNIELSIPIGNIAIIKKEPYNANIIETSNPSIGLKVWKSNVKIAQAELKLKFKDLSVNNFMPVVNNLDEYDMGEIRKIVKNYIDDKYGAHIEVNEPYTIDNQYTVIKDFDHNAVDNKYNLLWPTNYV